MRNNSTDPALYFNIKRLSSDVVVSQISEAVALFRETSELGENQT